MDKKYFEDDSGPKKIGSNVIADISPQEKFMREVQNYVDAPTKRGQTRPKPVSDFSKLKNRSYSTAELHNKKMQYIYDKSDVLQPVIKQEVDVEADTRLIGFGEIVESPLGRRFSMKEAFQTV